MSPKLSFGIPTYNGSKYIENTLTSILNQLGATYLDWVEILIIDNGSTDNTYEVVAKYLSQGNIKYFKNTSNIGYDRNVLKVIEHCNGNYIWLLADDDCLEPGAIDYVFNIIEKISPNVILVNFDHYDRSMQNVHYSLKIDGDRAFTEPSSFLAYSMGRYSLISSLIFRKSSMIDNYEKAIGLNFIHVYILMIVLTKGLSYIVAAPLVKFRSGSDNFGKSGDDLLKIAINYCDLLLLLRAVNYDKKILNSLLKKAKKYMLSTIVPAKLLGIHNKKSIIFDLFRLSKTPNLLYKYIPIIVMPTYIFRIAYQFKKKLSKKLKNFFPF